jgi:hypothetical protein
MGHAHLLKKKGGKSHHVTHIQSVKKKCGLWIKLVFSRSPLITQNVYLTSAQLFCWRNLVFTYVWAELIFWFCVVDFCRFNVWTWDFCGNNMFFFFRNSTSQNVYLSSADLGFLSAETHKSSDPWWPMTTHNPLRHVHFPTCTSRNGKSIDLGSWLWGPFGSKIGLPLSDHENGLNLPCVRIWNLNYLSWCKKMQTNVPQTRETFGDKKMYVQ